VQEKKTNLYMYQLVPPKFTWAQLVDWLAATLCEGGCLFDSHATLAVFFICLNFCHFNLSSLILSLHLFLFRTSEPHATTPHLELSLSLPSCLAAFRRQ